MEIPSLEEEPCVVLDTETNGGAAVVIELAVVGLRSGATLLNRRFGLPRGTEWNPFAERVHRIPRSALAGLPTCQACADQILPLLAGRVLIGHNLAYDVGALVRALAVASLGERRRMCTLQLARRYLALRDTKLGAVADALGLSYQGRAHSALVDAQLTREVYLAIRSRVSASP